METLVEEETSAALTRRFVFCPEHFNTCVRSLIRALSVSHIPSELHLCCRSMVSVWNHGDTNMLMFSVMPDEVVHTSQSMEAWEDEAVLQLWKLTKSAILSWSSLCFYLCLCTNQIVLFIASYTTHPLDNPSLPKRHTLVVTWPVWCSRLQAFRSWL